ncbi:discoidin domain-containing protein [Maridesulfovibrio zosterae]|uniref:discoidin domain-containing protein n=1 Tax=Maridesulfovibrio zosterae TaxID=82171 RepID=UPI000404DC2A|nr:discoidin domain-containing protein [Maridesulfovibrio zosterae]
MFRKFIFIIFIFLIVPAVAFAQTIHVSTSSFQTQTNSATFNSSVLTDGNYTTGWIDHGDHGGRGEWIKFSFPAKVIIDSLVIRNGIGTGKDFKINNRAKDIAISYSGGQQQGFKLQDIEKKQGLRIKEYPTTSINLSVRSVYSDGTARNVGISDISIEYHIPRKLSAEEKKFLSEKMSKLEHKKAVLNELKVFFDKFYRNFVTINEEYPRMFVPEHFLRESAMFESFRSLLETRGVLQKYHDAVVSTAGLRYSIRTLTPTDVELWVKGDYTVIYDMRTTNVHENALFHLKKEYGEWKVNNKLEY